MINLCSNNVFLLVTIERCHAFQAKVVRFGSSTGEYNFFGICSNQVSNFLTSIFAGLFCFPSETVRAGMRVSKTLSKEWKHFIEYSKEYIRVWIIILTLDRLELLLDYQDIEGGSYGLPRD